MDGSLEKYVATLPKPTGKASQRKLFGGAYKSVDEDFLQELDVLRDALARSFKNRNPHLNGDELTEATQRTIDRLVFMRFLEDKVIEPEAIIEKLGEGGTAWGDFVAESRRLDRIYNGIIFKHHAITDDPAFVVDECFFSDVRERLAHTNSPYDFNSLPVHILGSIYERFLGKVIVTTDKRARVEEKPEVRKAGGVYYTPEYIVRYIVNGTIGKQIAGKTPTEIAEMRFADVACGSGSFLLGMYDELLRYHTSYYNRTERTRAEGVRAGCVEREDKTLALSLVQKRDILLNNIYGVDIDAQAVEVAQLSLFLKLLEDETTATTRQLTLLTKEALLPNLNSNIKCGNSLIGRDITDGHLFETTEERKLNPMNFVDAFPKVMKQGGFNVIVGNPPYVRQELLGSTIKSYFQKQYKIYHGTADLYVYFFERYQYLLKPEGEFGIIVANKWMRAKYGEPLRRWLKNHRVEEITDFGDLPVFQGATTYPCVVRVRNAEANGSFKAANIETLDFSETPLDKYVAQRSFNVQQGTLENSGWSLIDTATQALLDKLRGIGIPLSEYAKSKIYRGVITGLNEAFVIDAPKREQLIAADSKSAELIKPFIIGRDVKRYESPQVNQYVILMPRGWTRNGIAKAKANITTNAAFKLLQVNFPAIAAHLAPFAGAAEKRCDKGEFWWELRACDYYSEFEGEKIVYPNICKQPEFALDESCSFTNQKYFIISHADKYLLGVLNSKVSLFLFHQILPKLRGGFFEPSYVYFKEFPIRAINFTNKADRTRHDRMVSLVEGMLAAKRQLPLSRTDRDRDFYENKCHALGKQIDDLVCELYELTDEEISLIEGNSEKAECALVPQPYLIKGTEQSAQLNGDGASERSVV